MDHFHRGVTYQYPIGGVNVNHLWFVLTDPDDLGEVLTANMSDLKNKETSDICILHQGDHPFVKYDSGIVYSKAELMNIESLHKMLKVGALRLDEIATDTLICKIIQSGINDDELVPEYEEILKNELLRI